jgi:two-component system, NtrC family, response regulator PilR
MSPAILVVDGETETRESIGAAFREAGHDVAAAASGQEALGWLERRHFDLIIAALMRGSADAGTSEILDRAGHGTPPIPVIVVAEDATLDSAVGAMRMGASDYLIRPVSVNELKSRVLRALGAERVQGDSGPAGPTAAIIGETPAIRVVRRLVTRVAASPSNVLIMGESGTGKELVARAIHAASPRDLRPFVAVNCGAIPDGLMESQLFGHVRGAFTGAIQASVGLLCAANGGTFVLDEIGEMPLALQVKLLRVIEDREVWPVGATKASHVDVRIIASTNRDLRAEVEAGRFREDLFYRLNVVRITMPPLRERAADIPQLTAHFIEKLNAKCSMACRGVEPAALRALMSYRWPGNVRELENVIERALAMGDGHSVTLADLPDEITATKGVVSETPTLREAVQRFEQVQILEALERTRFNKRDAARRLGISLASLYRKLGETPGAMTAEQ